MLTEFLAKVVAFLVSGAVELVEGVVPAEWYTYVETFAEQLGHLLSFGPASAIGVMVVGYYAVDLALNAYVFAITTYKLLPVKST